MIDAINKNKWEEFKNSEIKKIKPVLLKLGFKLDDKQVHMSGERYLMAGEKLVLTGSSIENNKKVIIKACSKLNGIKEIEREHETKKILNNLKFAYHAFFSPAELIFFKKNGFTISITEYIGEEKSFLNHSLKEQFFLAQRAFEIQEGAHATAYSHIKTVSKIFGRMNGLDYIDSFKKIKDSAIKNDFNNKNLINSLDKSFNYFKIKKETLEQYCGFLTHSDFVIHNLRIVNRDIFLLDQTSLYFGNKYESWARFLNYMILYNKPLEEALVYYVKNNRDKSEYLCLRLMRIYKIAFLLNYYSSTLNKSEGDLLKLNKIRIDFWISILNSILDEENIKKDIINDYIISRNKLRSEEEIIRQKKISQLY